MLSSPVTAGVTSSASEVRMSSAKAFAAAETLATATEALRCMPTASEVKTTRAMTANTPGFVPSARMSSSKEMGTA